MEIRDKLRLHSYFHLYNNSYIKPVIFYFLIRFVVLFKGFVQLLRIVQKLCRFINRSVSIFAIDHDMNRSKQSVKRIPYLEPIIVCVPGPSLPLMQLIKYCELISAARAAAALRWNWR